MSKLKVDNTIRIQFVTSANCAECIQVKQILKEIKSQFPNVLIQEYDVMGLKGLKLAVKHGVLANPGIIINDEFFSAGSLDKEKLFEKIKSLENSHNKLS